MIVFVSLASTLVKTTEKIVVDRPGKRWASDVLRRPRDTARRPQPPSGRTTNPRAQNLLLVGLGSSLQQVQSPTNIVFHPEVVMVEQIAEAQ